MNEVQPERLELGASGLPPLSSPADAQARESTQDADPGMLRQALGPDRIARRSTFGDHADKWLFGLFVIAGVIATIFAPTFGLQGFYAEAFPVGALIGYAGCALFVQSMKLHPDRLGDNCYYMGFVFTLTALARALYAVSSQTGDTRGAMLEGLIGSFGIALMSTIFGICLRVIFMQFRQEVEDVEQVIRNELQEAARTLKDHLSDAVGDLENFRLRTRQVMTEQLESQVSAFAATSEILAKHLGATGNAHVLATERLTQGSEQAARALAVAAAAMTDQVRAAGASQAEVAERLTSNAERVVGEVSRLVERIDRIEVPSDLLTRQVEDARQRIGELAKALEGAAAADAGRQAAVEHAAASLEKLLARLSDLTAFDTIEASAMRLSPAIEQASAAIGALGVRMASQADAFGDIVARAEADATAMAVTRRGLQADLSESAVALHKLQSTLADVAESLVRQLGDA
jgi:hypothetical protein